MAERERLLVAEDDPPLRLAALALGAPLDARMQTVLGRYFLEPPDASLARLRQMAAAAGATLAAFQSNSESELVERVQRAGREAVDFIIINPAAYTHTSVAMRDALAAVAIPFVEVHLTNVYAREPFRRHSHFTDLAVGIVSGLGATGYELALAFALQHAPRRSPGLVPTHP